MRDRESEPLQDGWSFRWHPNKVQPNPYGPNRWARWDHASGYSVGEVDAGRYMAAKDGDGLVDETGDYVSFACPHEAMDYVNRVRANEQR